MEGMIKQEDMIQNAREIWGEKIRVMRRREKENNGGEENTRE